VLALPLIIDAEINAELAAKRMSGPFSITQAHTIFSGHFCTSSLSLIEKNSGSRKWCMIHHLSEEDEPGESTNGWLNSDDFPTK